jgi:hypothetical protein
MCRLSLRLAARGRKGAIILTNDAAIATIRGGKEAAPQIAAKAAIIEAPLCHGGQEVIAGDRPACVPDDLPRKLER